MTVAMHYYTVVIALTSHHWDKQGSVRGKKKKDQKKNKKTELLKTSHLRII